MHETFSFDDRDALAIGRSAPLVRQQRRSRIGRATDHAGKALVRSIQGFCEGIAEGFRMSRRYEQLARMSDHELADLGISRGDIPAVVAGIHRTAETDRLKARN